MDYADPPGPPAVGRQCVVIDLCGVKRGGLRALLEQLARQHGFLYLGGHPMAGMEKMRLRRTPGRDLFQGASMILTPRPGCPRPGAGAGGGRWFLALGFGRVQTLHAGGARPDHRPHLPAGPCDLQRLCQAAPRPWSFLGFSAGSFQDMTRVARLNETMWTELFLENREYLAQEIDSLAQRLAEYGRAVRPGRPRRALYSLLQQARESQGICWMSKRRRQ